MADPGEFTLRAFSNGRIDLTQAEAVLNVVHSRTESALDAALNLLKGSLSGRLVSLRNGLTAALGGIEAGLDFPEEDLEPLERGRLEKELKKISQELDDLLEDAERGIRQQEGINVVLVGSPNAGKSSLMNRFLDYERVLVTHISGTTRDVVQETLNINGVPVRLADTAGITDSVCVIEQASVQRSLTMLDQADLVLFVLDGSRPLSDSDRAIVEKIKTRKIIVCLNKSDLAGKIEPGKIRKLMPVALVIKVSALSGNGMNELKTGISELFFKGRIRKDELPQVINLRHKQLLEECQSAVKRALGILRDFGYEECVAFELRQALDALSDVLGEDLGEEVLGSIFSRFCIGK